MHRNGQIEGADGAPAVDAAFTVPFVHRIRFTSDALNQANAALREVITAGEAPRSARCLVVVDDGVAKCWPDLGQRVQRYMTAHADAMEPAGAPLVVAGGEQAKNDQRVFDAVVRAIHERGICRRSYVIAIGGGAMLDAVGFAAATAHRGVRLVRLPTTTLAQDDAGVGVKNGINAFGKKNFLGCFSPPWAVINDEQFLTTLSDRDWRSGLSEAVKVALVKDASFFRQISAASARLAQRDHVAAEPIIRRCAQLHLEHIVAGGDPFELLRARPLDFGHWAAHKLEQMTQFRLKHGEAVAIGLAIDVTYSNLLGWLDDEQTAVVLDCLTDIGFVLHDEALADHRTLLNGLEEFREHLGGELTVTLLKGIGRPVDVHEIDRDLMVQAIGRVAAGAPPVRA